MEQKRLEDSGIAEQRIIEIISDRPIAMVLDTSVCIKWFSKDRETDLEIAISMLNSLENRNITIICPDLIIYELANVLYYKPDLNKEDVEAALSAFLALDIELLKLNKKMLIAASEIRYKSGMTFYDAAYVALAEFFKIDFITADNRLYDNCKNYTFVKLLKEYLYSS